MKQNRKQIKDEKRIKKNKTKYMFNVKREIWVYILLRVLQPLTADRPRALQDKTRRENAIPSVKRKYRGSLW